MTSRSSLNVGKLRRLQALAEKQQALGIPEPTRKSLFDVLQENFKGSDRVIYVNRLIYIGEHSFSDKVEGESISDTYEKVIKEVNSQNCLEKLTGFLLYYPQYFCVVLDGPEVGIAKHFDRLFDKPETKKRFGRMKILVCYHNIGGRFFDYWQSITNIPPTLLHTLDPLCGIEETYRQVFACVQKLYNLGEDLQPKLSAISEHEEVKPEEAPNEEDTKRLSLTINSEIDTVTEKRFMECLPEYALIEFILNSNEVQDVSVYHALYGYIPEFEFYEDKVWPIGTDFVPMDVFYVPVDPVTEFPEHLKELAIGPVTTSAQPPAQ